MTVTYIEPTLTIFDNLEELLEPTDNRSSPFKLSEFYSNAANNAWILGEPGSGKSALLRKIVNDASQFEKYAFLIPLNKIGSDTIEKRCLQQIKETGKSIKSSEIPNYENWIFCFDGLDEVNPNEFSKVLHEIKSFSFKYNKVSVYVSCRLHYIKKSISQIKIFTNPQYIKINSFSSFQIKTYLANTIKEGDNKESLIEILTKKSLTNKGGSILSIPRYLEVLVDILKDNDRSEEEILKMRRVDFFEEFVYQKLETEINHQLTRGSSIKENEKIITKRVLEKLALIMEIYQVNKISKDELMTFLDDTNSNANLIFLNHCDIDIFINRVLKLTDDILEFHNTEFQEYLAAKELLRLGQKSQVLYDLIIQPDLKHIYKNWYDVLRYVIELDAKQIMPLIDFLNQKGEFTVEDDYITLISLVDESKISWVEKEKIFRVIFSYYQKAHLFVWHDQAELLATFYQPKNYELLKSISVNLVDDTRLLSNSIIVIENLIKTGKLIEVQKNEWKSFLIEVSKNVQYPRLQIRALEALQSFMDLTIFKDLALVFENSKDRELTSCFIRCCSNIDPNDKFSINFFLDDIRYGRKGGMYGINRISQVKSIEYLLNKLKNDHILLEKFIARDLNFSSHDFTIFIHNLDENWNVSIYENLKDLLKVITENFNFYSSEKFLTTLIIQLDKRQTDFIYELIGLVPNDYLLHYLDDVICEIIRPYHVERFIKECQLLKNGEIAIGSVFNMIKHSKNSQRENVYEEGRKYLPELYKKWEENKRKVKTEEQKNWEIYQKFKNQLNFAPGYYGSELFSIYFNNKDILSRYISRVENKRMQVLLKNIFKHNDPKDCVINISNTSTSSRTLSVNNRHFFSYGFYLRVAIELNMQDVIKEYRRHFVQIIPTVDSHKEIELLLNYLGELNDQDIEDLLYMYDNRLDDLLIKSPLNTINLVKKLQRKEFIPVLKKMLDNEKMYQFEKEKALECLSTVFPDKDYLMDVFANNIHGDVDQKRLAEIANEYIIRNFKNPEALEWRFDEIKARKKPFIDNYSGDRIVRGYSDFEQEMDKPSFMNCIIDLMDISLMLKFHELLKLSFELRKDEKYVKYSNYLQKNVYLYYLNLKNVGSYLYIKKLRSLIDESLESKSFKSHFRNLEIQYIEVLNKPRNIADCIKKYNELKTKQYESILSSLDLFNLIEEIIDNDIEDFIQKEGFFKTIQKLDTGIGQTAYVNEDTIQKILKIQLENGLLKRGFRVSDIHREVELFDGQRLDLLISYGFVGPIMIEVKLLHNDEIQKTKERIPYKDKIKKYLVGTQSEYGFYLILKVKNDPKHDKGFKKLCDEYKDIENLQIKQKICY